MTLENSVTPRWRGFFLDQCALAALAAACELWRLNLVAVPGYGRNVIETMVFEGLMAVAINRSVARALGLGAGISIAVSYLAATAIDADHIIVAGSFDFMKVMNTETPVTHSLVFAAGLGLVGWVVTGRASWGWILFTAVATHVFWDATDAPEPRLPLWWPFSWYQMPRAFGYVGVEMLLLLNAGFVLRSTFAIF
ncbi:MAG: metal-dependent hydrolase [Nitrospirae bacterium]|nr:metal-dependent hydrolase [Nitrospirota bacterium]